MALKGREGRKEGEKKEMQMTNNYFSKGSTFLAIMEMQIETTLRFLSHPSQNGSL